MKNVSFNIVLLFFISYAAGCAKQKSQVDPSSPFASNKVQITQKENQDATATITTHNLDLHMIVNNVCVRNLEESEKENFLNKKIKVDFSKMLEIPVQSYIVTIDEALYKDHISDIINTQSCIIGITNNDKVVIPEDELKVKISQDVSIDGLGSYGHFSYLDAFNAKRTHFSSILNTGKPVVISIIDSGVDLNHTDLRRIKDKSVNFTNDSNDRDLNGHGTHVAGLAASMLDFNPNAVKIMNAKALSQSGSGYSSDIFNAVIYSVHNGADIINMSLSGKFDFSYITYAEAISYAIRNNVFVVLAAGNSSVRVGNAYDHEDDNEGKEGPWPSALATMSGVVNVGSMDYLGRNQRSTFSNFGPNVDIWAPGCGNSVSRPFRGMSSAKPGGGYVQLCGTSMASPVLAGIAALVIKHFRSQNKKLDVSVLEDILRISTKGADSKNTGETNLMDLAVRLKNNDVPQTPDFVIRDAHGRYVSDLYSSFLVKPHLTEEVRILTEVFRNERRSFAWLLGEVINSYPKSIKDCRRVISPLFYAASKTRQDSVEGLICNQFISNKITQEEMISSLLMSEGTLNYIDSIGLSHHPLSKDETGSSIDRFNFDLRKELPELVSEILLRPAMLSDLKFTRNAGSPQDVRRNILNSNDYYVLSLYKDVMLRNVERLYIDDFTGWKFWTNSLDRNEVTKNHVNNVFQNSDETWVRQAYRTYSDGPAIRWKVDAYVRNLQSGSKTRDEIIDEIRNRDTTFNYTPPPMRDNHIENAIFKNYYEEVDRYIKNDQKQRLAAPIIALKDNAKQKDALSSMRKRLRESNEGILVRMFYSILRRGPHTKERNDYLRYASNGISWSSIEISIKGLKPSEPDILGPNDPNEQIRAEIISLFVTYLERQPKASGLNYWISQFNNGESLRQIEWHISNSPEAKIRSFYRKYLNRSGKAQGVGYWVNQHKAGVTLDKIEWHISNSPESQLRNLYLLHFKREPDVGGKNFWLQKHKEGLEIIKIKRIFQRSSECKSDCL